MEILWRSYGDLIVSYIAFNSENVFLFNKNNYFCIHSSSSLNAKIKFVVPAELQF